MHLCTLTYPYANDLVLGCPKTNTECVLYGACIEHVLYGTCIGCPKTNTGGTGTSGWGTPNSQHRHINLSTQAQSRLALRHKRSCQGPGGRQRHCIFIIYRIYIIYILGAGHLILILFATNYNRMEIWTRVSEERRRGVVKNFCRRIT